MIFGHNSLPVLSTRLHHSFHSLVFGSYRTPPFLYIRDNRYPIVRKPKVLGMRLTRCPLVLDTILRMYSYLTITSCPSHRKLSRILPRSPHPTSRIPPGWVKTEHIDDLRTLLIIKGNKPGLQHSARDASWASFTTRLAHHISLVCSEFIFYVSFSSSSTRYSSYKGIRLLLS
jgi:hypothetical protein